MNINLSMTFTNLQDLRAFLSGVAAPAGAETAHAAPTLAVDNKDAAPAEKTPAKSKAKAAAPSAADKEQAEIDGNTNAGCIIMIRRVAAMDGKNADGTDKATGLAKATSIINSFGGVKVSELPKEKWPAFIADCKKVLDEKAAPAAAEDPTKLFG